MITAQHNQIILNRSNNILTYKIPATRISCWFLANKKDKKKNDNTNSNNIIESLE